MSTGNYITGKVVLQPAAVGAESLGVGTCLLGVPLELARQLVLDRTFLETTQDARVGGRGGRGIAKSVVSSSCTCQSCTSTSTSSTETGSRVASGASGVNASSSSGGFTDGGPEASSVVAGGAGSSGAAKTSVMSRRVS